MMANGCVGAAAEGMDLVTEGAGEKDRPGHDPDGEVEPEEPDWGEAVVMGDALGEETGDVLVVEIEPCPATSRREAEACGEHDRGGAECGHDVPRGCEGKEDQSTWEKMEFTEEEELFGEGEVEEDEANGKDQTD